ncbi:MAG: response regulator [Planctomyces sp.]|nr:response regulator [Planctomyces sp.]
MQRLCVLILDDSPEDRETIVRSLRGDPDVEFETIQAETAELGVVALLARRPDCLILDHDLPDSSSLEVLAELGRLDGGLPCAVIVVTGKGSEALAVNALKNGALDYLAKGRLTADLVRQTVRNAVEKHRLLQRIEKQQQELERLYRGEQLRGAELERRVTERDQFLAMLSHELRNPLSAVITAARLLNHPRLDARADREARTIIERQVEQITRLLEDLLDVSRVTLGKIDLRVGILDLNETVDDAVRSVSSLADQNGVHVVVSPYRSPLMIEGDATRLQQIQSNLLSNAIKFSPRGSKVILEVDRESGNEEPQSGERAAPREFAVIRVIDQGAGIRPEMIGRIFDMFVTSEQLLDRSKGGMGVGLTLVRALTELHGGTVTACSEGVGHGSRFEVRLPLATPSNPPGDQPRQDLAAQGCRKQLRVVLVEDQAANRLMLSKLLELQGHEVWSAEDGAAGAALILHKSPDVAIVDIGLPELDGYQVARKVRSEAAGRNVVLVALTGYGQPSDVEQALAAGFDHHLTKPLSRAALEQVLDGLH